MSRLITRKGPGERVPEDRSPNDMLTPHEVSEFLGVSLRALQVWDEAVSSVVGPPASHFTSSTVRYHWGDLLAWLDEHYEGDPGVDRGGDRLLRRQAVAEMVGVDLKTLERWQSGQVGGPPVVRISRTTVRYWEADVVTWARSLHERRVPRVGPGR